MRPRHLDHAALREGCVVAENASDASTGCQFVGLGAPELQGAVMREAGVRSGISQRHEPAFALGQRAGMWHDDPADRFLPFAHPERRTNAAIADAEVM